jgi:putative toxin-antitoxin system antitoxin component (TIGR02293 family)
MNTPRTDRTPTAKTRPAAARAAGFKTPINALRLSRTEPLELVQLEREGVPGQLVKSLAHELDLPMVRFAQIIGAPKATVERNSAVGRRVTGSGAYAALGTLRLLDMARELLAESTHPGARKVDPAKWLGQWIERPQPALGGKRPADLMDTPTGMAMVSRVLGAVSSGAYL